MVLTEKCPVIGWHEQAAVWLQIWTDLKRAPRTIDAHARGLAEYLTACEREDVDPVTAYRIPDGGRGCVSPTRWAGALTPPLAGRVASSGAWCCGG
jgi:hypothetical protein